MTSTDPLTLDEVVSRLPDGPEFTAALSIPETAGQVSAVIATYNRCPFDPNIHPINDNPLTWALDSLLVQAGDALAEIIVVDDGSTDHTPAVLAQYTRHSHPGEVQVASIRLGWHAGTAAARNTGIAAVRSRWVLFGDDDCVFSPHYALGAAYLMHVLSELEPATAAVMLPFYYRALRPREIRPAARIGVLAPETAEFATGFHTWPAEYLPHPSRLDERSGLLAPLPVRLIGGTAILDLAWLRKARGFRDLSSAWRSSYSDHLHLSADLTDAGATLYHCPDPRVSAAHLKFGAAGRFPVHDTDLATVISALRCPFAELVGLACERRVDTGCRMRCSTPR